MRAPEEGLVLTQDSEPPMGRGLCGVSKIFLICNSFLVSRAGFHATTRIVDELMFFSHELGSHEGVVTLFRAPFSYVYVLLLYLLVGDPHLSGTRAGFPPLNLTSQRAGRNPDAGCQVAQGRTLPGRSVADIPLN